MKMKYKKLEDLKVKDYNGRIDLLFERKLAINNSLRDDTIWYQFN